MPGSRSEEGTGHPWDEGAGSGAGYQKVAGAVRKVPEEFILYSYAENTLTDILLEYIRYIF